MLFTIDLRHYQKLRLNTISCPVAFGPLKQIVLAQPCGTVQVGSPDGVWTNVIGAIDHEHLLAILELRRLAWLWRVLLATCHEVRDWLNVQWSAPSLICRLLIVYVAAHYPSPRPKYSSPSYHP